MPDWPYTAGTVVKRELGLMHAEGGPLYYPQPTYTYIVGSESFTSNMYQYAHHGKRQADAQKLLDTVPDTVQVHYNPEKPSEAYLVKHTATVGYGLYGIAGLFWFIGLVMVLGSV